MPPALCLPPVILDQSFPRDVEELDRAAYALGCLQSLVDSDGCFLILTSCLMTYQECFEWQGQEKASYPLLLDLHRILTQWLLQPTDRIRCVSTEGISAYQPHPVPTGSGVGPLIDIWSAETGKLYAYYLAKCAGIGCVGVACDFAFSELPLGAYEEGADPERFPLVGPAELPLLDDFEEWSLPQDIHQHLVSVAAAKKHLYLLGGQVADEAEGSHYKVRIAGAPRPWILDQNDDPIPPRFLKELADLVKYEVEVVRYVLVFGKMPERKARF